MTLLKPYLILIRSLLFILFDSIALWVAKDPKRNQPKVVLLIRQDAIGDFILWLDTAKEYRKHFPPENHKIVLIGNALWCDLAKELPFWDEVLTVNVKAFKTLSRYRWNIIRKVKSFGAEIAIQPTYSREFYHGDSLIRASNASKKVSSAGNMSNRDRLKVTILREGGPAAPQIGDEPQSISKASEVEGYVNVVARILTTKPEVIVRRDGSGQIDVTRGRLADPSGSIGFLSWVPFEHQEGSLVKITGASVRKFRDTPEISINDGTVIEPYHDTAFPDMSELAVSTKSTIADLRNGMRDVGITLQVESWNQRTFTSEDGSQKVVRSGDVIDPSGRCRLTAWCEFDPAPGDFIRIEGGRVQFWQGSPDLVIDQREQVIDLSDPPWEKIDPEGHWIDLDLTSLVNGGSRRGIRTSGTVVAVRPDSGIVERCPECRRVLRDGACTEHGPQRGQEDLRLRFVIDNGVSNASLLMSREPAEAFLGLGMDGVRDQIASEGREGFVASLRARALSGAMVIHGRTIVDDQGAMVLADTAELEATSPSEAAQKVMEKWGVVL